MSVPITVTAVIQRKIKVKSANSHTNSKVKKLQSGSEVTSNVQLHNLKDSLEYLKAMVCFLKTYCSFLPAEFPKPGQVNMVNSESMK